MAQEPAQEASGQPAPREQPPGQAPSCPGSAALGAPVRHQAEPPGRVNPKGKGFHGQGLRGSIRQDFSNLIVMEFWPAEGRWDGESTLQGGRWDTGIWGVPRLQPDECCSSRVLQPTASQDRLSPIGLSRGRSHPLLRKARSWVMGTPGSHRAPPTAQQGLLGEE